MHHLTHDGRSRNHAKPLLWVIVFRWTLDVKGLLCIGGVESADYRDGSPEVNSGPSPRYSFCLDEFITNEPLGHRCLSGSVAFFQFKAKLFLSEVIVGLLKKEELKRSQDMNAVRVRSSRKPRPTMFPVYPVTALMPWMIHRTPNRSRHGRNAKTSGALRRALRATGADRSTPSSQRPSLKPSRTGSPRPAAPILPHWKE